MTNIVEQNRVAVFLGAAAGYGPGIARTLGLAGMDLVLIGPRDVGLTNVAEDLSGSEISVAVLDASLDNPGELRSIAREARSWLTRVDVLVCNAAPQHVDPGFQLSLGELAGNGYASLEVSAEMCKEFLPGMIKRRWGRIIFVPPMYTADELVYLNRGGIKEKPFNTFSRLLASEIGRSRITVNSVMQVAASFSVACSALKEQARILGLPVQCCTALLALQERVSHLPSGEQMQAVVSFVAGKPGEHINGMLIPVCGQSAQRAVA